MTIAPLLRAMSGAGCSILIEDERIEMLGRFPDDLLERVKARRLCVRSVLKGAMIAGMGPLFGPDDLAELADDVETEDREILERRWVIARPWDYSDWPGKKNRPEDAPCGVPDRSEGAEPTNRADPADGLYGPEMARSHRSA